jgi:hypothetical protein
MVVGLLLVAGGISVSILVTEADSLYKGMICCRDHDALADLTVCAQSREGAAFCNECFFG